MRTFRCDFGGGVACTVRMPDAPPGPGLGPDTKIEWSGKPARAHTRPYIAWMNSVNQKMAEEWGKKIMHAYEIDPGVWEIWRYEPGAPPKKEKTIRQ